MLSVTLIGISGSHSPTRAGAKQGDAIFITGQLGESHLGHHYSFQPRVKEGQWLGQFGVNAMMDVSDGLASDLEHISTASDIGISIDLEHLPLRSKTSENHQDALANAFCQGEDYELVFTLDAAQAKGLHAAWPFETQLTMIGKCDETIEGVETFIDGKAVAIKGGWRPKFDG